MDSIQAADDRAAQHVAGAIRQGGKQCAAQHAVGRDTSVGMLRRRRAGRSGDLLGRIDLRASPGCLHIHARLLSARVPCSHDLGRSLFSRAMVRPL